MTIALMQVSLVIAAASMAFASTQTDAHVRKLAFAAGTLAGITAAAAFAALARFIVGVSTLAWERRLTWIALGGLSLNLIAALSFGVSAVFGRTIAVVALVILAVFFVIAGTSAWGQATPGGRRRRLRAIEIGATMCGFYLVAWLAVLRLDGAMYVVGLLVLGMGLVWVALEALLSSRE